MTDSAAARAVPAAHHGPARLVCTVVRVPEPRPAGADVGELAGRLPDGQVVWRLLSANNRQLGRGATACADRSSAWAAASSLAGLLGAAEPRLAWLGRRLGWTWTLSVAGAVQAVSGRGYERVGVATQALAAFVTGLPEAVRAEMQEQRHP